MRFLHETVKKLPHIERIVFYEDFFGKVDIYEKGLKRELRSAFENEEVPYIKKIILDIICALMYRKIIDKYMVVSILLDIEENDGWELEVAASKYLESLYDDDPYIYDKLSSFRDSLIPDVAAEAYYRLGRIEFYSISNGGQEQMAIKLDKASQYFLIATQMEENRNDALFYYNLVTLIQTLMYRSGRASSELIKELNINLFDCGAHSYNNNYFAIEYKMYKIACTLQKLHSLASNYERWLRVDEEFKKLSKYHHDILNIELTDNEMYRRYINSIKSNLHEDMLKPLYKISMNGCIAKLEALRVTLDAEKDKDVISYLDYLKDIITYNSKKKEDFNLMEIAFKIHSQFPKQSIELIVKQLKERNFTDPAEISSLLDLLESYQSKVYSRSLEVLTGSKPGEEIFFQIRDKVIELIPNYRHENLNMFLNVVEYIIAYVSNTIIGEKDSYRFLYSSQAKGLGDAASEKDLQDSLYKFLSNSRLNSNLLHYEKSGISDGGRVDILVSDGNISLPIELKKTKETVTDEGIREKYLAQVSTYIYPHNQLGIFVLLDLTEKTKPINDLRSLFKLEHMQPAYNIEDKYPDYVLRVIVPGNKNLPSYYSTYK